MRFAALFPLIVAFGLVNCSVSAQTPAIASDHHLLYFDEALGLPRFHKTTVFRGYQDNDSFYLLPTGVQSKASDMGIQYRNVRGQLTGNLTLTIEPAFDTSEFADLVKELQALDPNARYVVVEPISSEWDILGFGLNATVTPTLMSNPLLSRTSLSVPLPPTLLKVLLHEGSQHADVFVVRHKFGVRGIELDVNMQPRLDTRWFSRGVSFTGNCASQPERFLNIDTGTTGCIFKVIQSPNDVRTAQLGLRKAGFYKSGVDGVFGEASKTAVKDYQRSHNVLVDGLLSQDLLEALRSR